VLKYGRDFTLAFLAQFWFTIAATMWVQYARWIHFLGGDERDVGWIMGVGVGVALMLRPWLAEVISRFGSKRSWVAGMLLLAASALGNVFIVDLGLSIYVLQAISTAALAACYASGLTYVTDIAEPSKRTRMIGAFGVAGFCGVLVGPWLGDLVLGDWTDGLIRRSRMSFVYLFVGTAFVLMLSIVLAIKAREPRQHRVKGSLQLMAFFRTLRSHWPGAVVWVNFAFGICMTVPFRFLPRFIDEWHLGDFGLRGFFLVYAGVGILVRATMRDWPERWGLKVTIVSALLLFAAGLMIFPLIDSRHVWVLAIPAFICGTAHAVVFHCMVSLTVDPFPPERRGSGTVLALMMQDIAQVICMPVLGMLADRDFIYLFWAVAASSVVSAIYFGIRGRSNAATADIDSATITRESAGASMGLRSQIGEIPAVNEPKISSCQESPICTAAPASTPTASRAC
jgi:MFS family permease